MSEAHDIGRSQAAGASRRASEARLCARGCGGSAGWAPPLSPPLLDIAPRLVLLELPGHGRSPPPATGPLSAIEYGNVVTAVVERMHADYGKIAIVGSSLGGALA